MEEVLTWDILKVRILSAVAAFVISWFLIKYIQRIQDDIW